VVARTGCGADCVVVCQRSSNGTGEIIAGGAGGSSGMTRIVLIGRAIRLASGMIRCVIFACLEQNPQRSNAAQAACGYRVLQREHQL
jgi:hypothetical protein